MVRELDRNRAKMVILEIIRQCGGELQNKTNLFKAFWKAHVFAASNGHCLTHYPIVRMTHGPGIDDFDGLLGEMLSEGLLTTSEPTEQYEPFAFHLTSKGKCAPHNLSDTDRTAIADGARFVHGKTATCVSRDSHNMSRSWNLSRDGQEIDIILDSIPEDEFRQRQSQLAEFSSLVDGAFGSRRAAND